MKSFAEEIYEKETVGVFIFILFFQILQAALRHEL